MTILSNMRATTLLTVAVLGFAPCGAVAQGVTGGDSVGVFAFSGFGAPQLDDLPLEMASETETAEPLPPLIVTNLGVTPAAPVTPPAGSERIIIRNTWAIGVYR